MSIIDPAMLDGIIKALIIFIFIDAAFIITIRDLLSLVNVYAVQSFLLAAVAGALFLKTGSYTLLSLAALILLSKVIVIPQVISKIQKSINVKRDMAFYRLSPTGSILVSIFSILVVYSSFSRIFGAMPLDAPLFLGAVMGVSLTIMGMTIIFTRKRTIVNIVGYLTMENGVLLFGLFLAELPLIIEVLIVLDLIVLTLLAAVLALGIDSTIEEFHARLNPFQKPLKED